jgi:adenylate cyclase
MLWLLTVTSMIWTATTSRIDPNQNPCTKVKNNTLKLKGEDIFDLSDYCDCTFDELKIKNAIISELPKCFEEKEINSLVLENIQPTTFPKGISELTSLTLLSFKNTELAFLPNEIAELKSLRELDLRGTRISHLPEGLDHLKKIDLRLTELNKAEQEAIRSQYPNTKIYFSSPCNCH